jgi:hypothetical protein
MICRADAFLEPVADPVEEDIVLVGHNPITVFATTEDHLSRLKKKPDGHYNREDLMTLVQQGHANMYDEKAVHHIVRAFRVIIWGCPTF